MLPSAFGVDDAVRFQIVCFRPFFDRFRPGDSLASCGLSCGRCRCVFFGYCSARLSSCVRDRFAGFAPLVCDSVTSFLCALLLRACRISLQPLKNSCAPSNPPGSCSVRVRTVSDLLACRIIGFAKTSARSSSSHSTAGPLRRDPCMDPLGARRRTRRIVVNRLHICCLRLIGPAQKNPYRRSQRVESVHKLYSLCVGKGPEPSNRFYFCPILG